ncbi:hypothetical protein [Micromonospora sp. NPDC049282]
MRNQRYHAATGRPLAPSTPTVVPAWPAERTPPELTPPARPSTALP